MKTLPRPEPHYLLNTFTNLHLATLEFMLGLLVVLLKGTSVDVGTAYAIYNIAWLAGLPILNMTFKRLRPELIFYLGFSLLVVAFIMFGLSLNVQAVFLASFMLGLGNSLNSAGLLFTVAVKGGRDDANMFGDLMLYGLIGAGVGGFIGFIALLASQFLGHYLFYIKFVFITYTAIAATSFLLIPRLNAKPTLSELKPAAGHGALPILVSTSLLGVGQGALYPMLIPFLVKSYGLTPFEVMLAYIPAGIGWFIASRIGGTIITKYRESLWIAFTTTISSVIAFLISFRPAIIILSALWGIEGVGLSIWTLYVQHEISRALPFEQWGPGYSALNSTYYFSYAVGAAAGGVLFSLLGPVGSFWTASALIFLVPFPIIITRLHNNKVT